jgi:hypothetical protein
MSGLLLPRHVAVERAKQQASEAWDNRKIRVSVPQLPEGMEAKKAPDNDADDPNVEPIGDARAQHAALARAFEDAGKDVVQDADQAIPEGLPDPTAWRVVLMPVRQVIKQGSIFSSSRSAASATWSTAAPPGLGSARSSSKPSGRESATSTWSIRRRPVATSTRASRSLS